MKVMLKEKTTKADRIERKQTRFDEIIDASATLFARKGFDATLNEIAEELGITGAALYYYIKNKDQLLYEIWQRAGANLQMGLEEELSGDTPTLIKLRNFFRRHLHTIIDNRAIFEVLILQRSSMPEHGAEEFTAAERFYANTLAELLSEIPKEQLRVDEPRLMARAIIAMLNGVIRWYSDSYRLSLNDIADSYFETITGGIVYPDYREGV